MIYNDNQKIHLSTTAASGSSSSKTMGASALLLYRPPHGGAPTPADTELLAAALGRAGCATQGRQPEKTVEARIARLSQAPPRDPSAVAAPRALADVWALQLPRAAGAAGRAFLINPKARQLAEADAAAVPALLERRLEYRAKAVLLVTGRAWPVGERRGSDARVHLLQLQAHGRAPLAVALRIEYAPAACREAAAPVLDDLAAALQRSLDGGGAGGAGGNAGGALEPLQPRWEDWAAWLPAEFGPAHEALLYFDLVVAALRARGGAGAGAGGANAAGGVPRAPAGVAWQQQQQQQQQHRQR